MPGARSYIQSAMDKGYVDKSQDIVYHVLAIAVPKGNPGNITGVQDLVRPGVRVAIGEPPVRRLEQQQRKLLGKSKHQN